MNLNETYSDYELYQILESNNFKTTENNLRILKEGLDTDKYEIIDEAADSFLNNLFLLDENTFNNFVDSLNDSEFSTLEEIFYNPLTRNGRSNIAARWGVHKANKNVEDIKAENQKSEAAAAKSFKKEDKAQLKADKAELKRQFKAGIRDKKLDIKKTAASGQDTTDLRAGLASYKKDNKKKIKINAQAAAQKRQDKKLGKLRAANEKKLAAAEATQQTVKTNFDNMKQAQAKSEKEKSAKQKTDKLKPTKGLSLAESYSDYELYQILKENSFKTTENNLRILKEGLASGRYEIAED